MFQPSQDDFIQRAQDESGNLLLVHTELQYDALTPMTVFRSLQEGRSEAFLLESVEHGADVGRYTFVGVDALALIIYQDGRLTITREGQTIVDESCQNPFDIIREFMKLFQPLDHPGAPPFIGGAVGYIAYDVIRVEEDIPLTVTDDLNIPDIFLMVTDRVLVFDHARHKIHVVGSAYLDEDRSEAKLTQMYQKTVADIQAFVDEHLSEINSADLSFQDLDAGASLTSEEMSQMSNTTYDEFVTSVQTCKDYVQAGDILQVVLSQRFACPTKADPFEVYRVLREVNPSPYMFYVKCGDFVLTGSSPETMVAIDHGTVRTKPIAGTRKRGQDDAEDQALAEDLLQDPKERAEHLMLVDLGRNDIGRIALKDSVRVSQFMEVEKYSHVMHIVSEVEGELDPTYDPFDTILATFPAGTLSGAPKIRAMEIIDELEVSKRCTYGGLAGYIGFDGQMDTCITIRSMVFKEDVAYVQAGAGIVADSDPDAEYQESVNKAMAVVRAIKIAEEL